VSELSVTWQPIVVLVPIIIIIALILRRVDRKNESKRVDAETRRWQEVEDKLKTAVSQAVQEAFKDKPSQKGDDKKPISTKTE